MLDGEKDRNKGTKGLFEQLPPKTKLYMDYTNPDWEETWLLVWHYGIPGSPAGAESRVLCLKMGTCKTPNAGAFATAGRREDVNCQECLEWLHA